MEKGNGRIPKNEIKTVADFVKAFREEPQCRDCKYCRANYAPMAPTSHLCENDEVENDFIIGEDKPCDKWEYRQGESALSTEDVFYSANPQYRNLSVDDEWYDD